MRTRKEYLNGECTHREYYAQFVTETTKQAVLSRIGGARLLASTDEHLNDIPLKTWDTIPAHGNGGLTACGDYPTKAGNVCIVKEAARQIIEEVK